MKRITTAFVLLLLTIKGTSAAENDFDIWSFIGLEKNISKRVSIYDGAASVNSSILGIGGKFSL